MKLKLSVALVFIMLMLAQGCARSPDDSYSSVAVTGDFATPFQIVTDNFVRRQKPAVYVKPVGALDHRPTALFVPLRMVQNMNNAVTFTDMLSRQIWQVWLSLGIFNTLEYAPYAGPFERSRALALARQKHAELLVGGYINHYFDGGSGGESSVTIAMDVYDVKTGNLLWSISQGGLMEKEKKHDFYLFNITERNPADPSGLIARSLAWDMGRLLLKWVDPYADTSDQSLWQKMTKGSAF